MAIEPNPEFQLYQNKTFDCRVIALSRGLPNPPYTTALGHHVCFSTGFGNWSYCPLLLPSNSPSCVYEASSIHQAATYQWSAIGQLVQLATQ